MRCRSLNCCFRNCFCRPCIFKLKGALPFALFVCKETQPHYNSQVRFYAELLVSMGATKGKEQP